MGKDVMVALDFPSGEEALRFLDLFQKEERKPYVKVGMELFYSCLLYTSPSPRD